MTGRTDVTIAFPWLPLGTPLSRGTVGKLLASGPGWQVCATDHVGQVAVLLAANTPEQEWRASELAALEAHVPLFTVAQNSGLRCALLPSDPRPTAVSELTWRGQSVDAEELSTTLRAFCGLHRRIGNAVWSSAIIFPTLDLALSAEVRSREDRRALMLGLMSGGAGGARLTAARVSELNPKLKPTQVADALKTVAALTSVDAFGGSINAEVFSLPGQPRLEVLLREKVVDVLVNRDRYEALRVKPPNGLLLAGPTGCGKSFAAERLAKYLDWPVHEVSLMEVGSKWLHETSGRLAAAFDAAAVQAPAILLLEEIDALGASRANERVALDEEVNALLRLVERAGERGLLVIATTNRLEAVDPALRRAGRFDLILVMDYPDEKDAEAMLDALLMDRPRAPGLDIAGLARRLARRPASDLAWVVNEAARLTARAGTERIDSLTLTRAANELLSR